MGKFFLVEFILNLLYTGENRGIFDKFSLMGLCSS